MDAGPADAGALGEGRDDLMGTCKAVILARGLGTRMRREDTAARLDAAQAQVAAGGVKAMIPIGRPFLDHAMTGLADAGITDVCLVIGPEHAAIRTYYDALTLRRIRVHYAIQPTPDGTAGAVAAAEPFADGETVLVMNGDNYYPVVACRALADAGGSGVVGFGLQGLIANSNIPAERVRQFALLQRDADGFLTGIVEKPDEATYAALVDHSLVSMNLWSFSPVIYEACRRVQPSVRGELELQDAVRIAMGALGERFRVVESDAGVLDLSTRGDIESVAAVLRDRPVDL
ncbi:MAG: nucleotidyltransferase family protein [Gemmatimonadaceae bacterium]|nr:nucleotidyltransferase family protein [Gemmatimonadaceae bacterium]